MMLDLSKIFALPDTFLKLKNYCTANWYKSINLKNINNNKVYFLTSNSVLRPALFFPAKIIKVCKSVKRKLLIRDFKALSVSSLYPSSITGVSNITGSDSVDAGGARKRNKIILQIEFYNIFIIKVLSVLLR